MTQTRSGWGKESQLASRLRERVRIEAVEEAGDGQGGVTRNWVLHAECFAEVTALSLDVAERMDAAQHISRLAYRIVLRVRDDITSQMRVVWKGRLLNIRAVIAGDAAIELLAEEGGAV